MRNSYYDPMFYMCSEKMDFNIKVEIVMKAPVEKNHLDNALQIASKRFPYFCIKVLNDGKEIYAAANDKPIVVYEGENILPLGSDEVNGHMFAVSFYQNRIWFHCSHVIADGRGMMPFVKTILHYYICSKYGLSLDESIIYPAGSNFFPDETGNPFPEEKIKSAEAFYHGPCRKYFKLENGPYAMDSEPTVYKIRVNERDIVKYSHENDASPCALVSSLIAKTIWDVHRDVREDLVSAISFDQRPAIKNMHNYRMLCSSLRLFYPERLRNAEMSKICTCTRGMISLQSQEENVLFNIKNKIEMLKSTEKLQDIEAKKKFLGDLALEDANNNTYSVSYIGKIDWGDMLPYIDSVYIFTDACTYKNLFVEISILNGYAYITFLQGFSSNVYLEAFKKQLDENFLRFDNEEKEKLEVAKTILPKDYFAIGIIQ